MTILCISILITILLLFRNLLDKIASILNQKIIKSENRITSILFLAKSKNLAKFKILFKSKNIRAIKDSHFLIGNIKKVFKILR